jgi:hypothetical protein
VWTINCRSICKGLTGGVEIEYRLGGNAFNPIGLTTVWVPTMLGLTPLAIDPTPSKFFVEMRQYYG